MENNDKRVLKFHEYAGFACGVFANGIQSNLFTVFMIAYLNAALGMNPLIVGTMILIIRITDAFTDIGFSLIGDRTKTKIGSYRPWLIAATIPAAVCLGLFFGMPASLRANPNSGGAIAWMYIFFFLSASILLTIHSTSLGAMAITASPNEKDRNLLGLLRQWGNQVSAVLIYFIGMKIILAHSDGEPGVPTASGYSAMGWIFALISFVGFAICCFTVKERVPVVKSGEKVPLKKSLKAIGKNPIAWGALIANVAIQIIYIIFSGMNTYIFGVVYNNPALMGTAITIAMLIGLAFTTFITPIITSKVSRRVFYPIAMVVELIGFVILYFATAKLSLVLFIVGYTIYMCVSSLMAAAVFQVLPDGAIYGEWLAGCKIPGLINALTSFANKIAMGVSTIFITAVLAAVKFDASLGMGNQTMETVQGIRRFYCFGPAIALIIALIGYFMFTSVKKDKMDAIKKELAERDSIAASANASVEA